MELSKQLATSTFMIDALLHALLNERIFKRSITNNQKKNNNDTHLTPN